MHPFEKKNPNLAESQNELLLFAEVTEKLIYLKGF